jgi:hypothetical protein
MLGSLVQLISDLDQTTYKVQQKNFTHKPTAICILILTAGKIDENYHEAIKINFKLGLLHSCPFADVKWQTDRPLTVSKIM